MDDPRAVEVCLDDACGPVDEPITVVGDEPRRSLLVRTGAGAVLAGPQVVELPFVNLNGEGFDGGALRGDYVVGADGAITER